MSNLGSYMAPVVSVVVARCNEKIAWADSLADHVKTHKATPPTCEYCKLPCTVQQTKRCSNCINTTPCGGPYCKELGGGENTFNLECVKCEASDMCPNCIDASGCCFCGDFICEDCAFFTRSGGGMGRFHPLDFTICSEACARKAAMRLKRAKINESDE